MLLSLCRRLVNWCRRWRNKGPNEMASGWRTACEEARIVEDETSRSDAVGLGVLHEGMNVFFAGMELANPQNDDPARLLQMGFISQSFNTLFLAVRAASMGLHVQAIGLMRFVFEYWATYWYLNSHPENADRWLGDAKDRKPPKLESMLKGMKHPDAETEQKARSHRSTLHRFAHSDSFAVNYLFDDDGGNRVVRWGVTYDQGKCEASFCTIAVELGHMLDALSQFVAKESEWHSKNASVTERLVSYIDGVQERHRRTNSNE